jgi:hypothetical protein
MRIHVTEQTLSVRIWLILARVGDVRGTSGIWWHPDIRADHNRFRPVSGRRSRGARTATHDPKRSSLTKFLGSKPRPSSSDELSNSPADRSRRIEPNRRQIRRHGRRRSPPGCLTDGSLSGLTSLGAPCRVGYKWFPSWNSRSSKVILPSTLYFFTAPLSIKTVKHRSRPLSLLIETQTRSSSVIP